jgi:hypothetical protein
MLKQVKKCVGPLKAPERKQTRGQNVIAYGI